jgi:hypothetical protein
MIISLNTATYSCVAPRCQRSPLDHHWLLQAMTHTSCNAEQILGDSMLMATAVLCRGNCINHHKALGRGTCGRPVDGLHACHPSLVKRHSMQLQELRWHVVCTRHCTDDIVCVTHHESL